jgi:D-alanine-D-alanine ligase
VSKVRVAVLMGGRSSEREVSLWSGGRVADALDRERYEVTTIDCANAQALFSLAKAPVDVAFIALHGRYGEDGRVQGMLDLLGIPYVGSGVLSSALAMNKWIAKKLLAVEGIPTPEWRVLAGPAAVEQFVAAWAEKADARRQAPDASKGSPSLVSGDEGPLPLPVVVKPNEEGSTIGMTIVRTAEAMIPAVRLAARHDATVLIEQFVAGTEITAAVIGNRDPEVLPLVEIVPQGGFYDYERKYTPGATEEIVPARISEQQAARARDLAMRAHHVLQCRGLSRVDMIVADEVYVLEVNTLPGMTGTSLVPRAAEAAGISFPRLVERLIALALEDESQCSVLGARCSATAVACHEA